MNTENVPTTVVEYSKIDAAIATLRERFAGKVYDVQTSEGMKEARAARNEVKGYRVEIEHTRKAIKEPALRRCQDIDNEARRITRALADIEDPIAAQIKAEEDRVERERADAERRERERVDGIRRMVATIRERPMAVAKMAKATDMLTARENLARYPITVETFAELAADAEAARAAALAEIDQLYDAQVRREMEAKALAEEREAIARERADNEAREAEARKVREAEEARIAEARAKLQREQDEAAARERRKAADEEAERQRKERERVEAEQAAERAAEEKAKAGEREAEQRRFEAAQARMADLLTEHGDAMRDFTDAAHEYRVAEDAVERSEALIALCELYAAALGERRTALRVVGEAA